MAALEQQSHGRMNTFEVFFIVFWLRSVLSGCNLFLSCTFDSGCILNLVTVVAGL